VLFYEPAEGAASFADVQAHGSTAIFTGAEAARAFAEGDPVRARGRRRMPGEPGVGRGAAAG